MENITPEIIELIKKPLPPEAITQHPTKTYLSSIKAIYVTERLNEVFGIGAWTIKTDEVTNAGKGMIVVKVTFEVPRYGIYYESFGGNDNGGESNKNFDLGDAYKGATTDAITKIASYIGIGIDVFKGKGKTTIAQKQFTPQKQDVSKSDDDAKPWFNSPEFKDFMKVYTNYKTADEALAVIQSKYKVNKTMRQDIINLYA